MAVYDLTQVIPSKIKKEDVLNCPYSGRVISLTLPKGTYKLECWGAQGGLYNSSYSNSGKGGYTKGLLKLQTATVVYLYTGQYPGVSRTSAFNGGGSTSNYGGAGGGASDIRLGTDSLYARVIVAAGGGGNGYSSGGDGGGYGGGEVGGTGVTGSYAGGNGGTQTAGGASAYSAGAGSFGQGGSTTAGGGGAGGWYGGGSGAPGGTDSAGGGGSSYYYTAETAVNYPSGCLLNSSHYLTEALTIAGNTTMVSPTGTSAVGNSGNGYIRITVTQMSNVFYKNSGEWQSIDSTYLKTDGSWQLVESVPKNRFKQIILKTPATSTVDFLYDTKEHTIQPSQYLPEYMNAYDYSSSLPGNHVATYQLIDNISQWDDSTKTNKTINWFIRMKIPTAKSALYTGSTVSPEWSNYYSSYMTLGGTTEAIEVGTYTATATLNSGLQWSDGTTEVKNITWRISNIPRDNLAYEFLFETDASDTSGNGVVLSNATLIDGGGITGKCIGTTTTASFTSNLMGANDWSVCFWVKSGTAVDSSRKWIVFFGQYDVMGSANSCHLFMNDYNRMIGWVGDNNVGRNCINFEDLGYCDSQWHCVCIVNDYSNGQSRWYIDGNLIQTTGNYTQGLFSSTMYFGKEFTGVNPNTTFFDNVRGYRKALSYAEVLALYSEF